MSRADAQTNPRLYNERFVIRALGTIHGAEMTYQATVGAGIFGSLAQVRQVNYIDEALGSGNKYGYAFALTATPP